MNVYPKDFLSTSPTINGATCFVLMPFAEKYNEVYNVIKATVESDALMLTCERGYDFFKSNFLETDLVKITKAEYLIADLTGQDSNVFYGLGLAHCAKQMNNIILITQDIQDVPFVLRKYQCIEYEQSVLGDIKLHNDLVNTFNTNIGQQFTVRLTDFEKVSFPEKIPGDRSYLYELTFETSAIGRNASKLQIHFKISPEEDGDNNLPVQYLYLNTKDASYKKMENIPWQIRLIKAINQTATFSLQKLN